MKSQKWRLFRCMIPIFFGLFIVGIATWNQANPGNPSFLPNLNYNMGVDLAGGTILVYELDADKETREGYSKDKMVAALKRRLDPADLYNITVRPLGETRFEIILPTGGRHRADADRQAWQALLAKVKEKYPALKDHNFETSRGQVNSLKDEIDRALTAKGKEVNREEIGNLIGENYQATTSHSLTSGKVEELKNLIHRVGNLEFRILANETDDSEALSYMTSYFKKARDSWNDFVKIVETNLPKVKEGDLAAAELGNLDQLKALAKKAGADVDKLDELIRDRYRPTKELQEIWEAATKGTRPPAPVGQDAGMFEIELEGGEKEKVSYTWLEIGKTFLHDPLELNNANEKPTDESKYKELGRVDGWTKMLGPRNWLFNAAKEAREQGRILVLNEPFQNQLRAREESRRGLLMQRIIIYSRTIPNPDRLPEEDRPNPEAGKKGKIREYYVLTRKTPNEREVTGEYLVSATEGRDKSGRPSVDFRFNAEGAKRFYDLTRKNKPSSGGHMRHLGVVLDDMVMSAPTINDAIHDRGTINGIDDIGEVRSLVRILRAGSLPGTLKPTPVSENTMGALLGDDTIKKGRNAILFAFIGVLVFMVYYYRFAGLVACLALLANLVLTIAFMLIVNAAFTLPGLAGLVLMLAMAVDANILIYERIREERDRGASMALAIRNGYERAFPTIIDTHLSSIFTAIVLYVVGNDQLKGFGISLTVGLIISLYTALYMTRVVFDFWLNKGWLSKLSMTRWLQNPNINFMRIRKAWFTATVLLTVLGITIFLMRGNKGLNMDFVGGTVYSGELQEGTFMSVNDLRTKIEENHETKLALADGESVKRVPGTENEFVIHYKHAKGPITVRLPQKATVEEVRQRATSLPDPSVELIYHGDDTVTKGETSRLFTVRTTEKANELARAMINRLLTDDNHNTLQRETELVKTEVKEASLDIARPGKTIDEMVKAIKDKDVLGADSKIRVDGIGRPDKNQRYQQIRVTFTDPVTASYALKQLSKLKEKKLIQDVSFQSLHLTFSDYAFTAQVQALLQDELRRKEPNPDDPKKPLPGLLSATESITIDADESKADSQGKQKELTATLPEPKNAEKVVAAVDRVKAQLKAFPLPERMETFDSQLAADTQAKALAAIVMSWLAILMYLWFRFGNWTFGLAAVLCLIHDLCFTLGIIAFSHYLHGTGIGVALGLSDFKIDLPTVAALLTLVGFSVNDTIVVFDRIREVRGKNPNLTPEMINTSINQTLSRTILTSLIAFLVVLVLYIWGGNGIHLFAFVMVVGVIVGTYSSVFVACPLLLLFGEGAQTGPQQEETQPQTPPAETAEA